ncbi:hypothetical protein CTheo_8665 [Ceratobasidium theobromae]|uniref:Uncharacterized protein n=1 Tax=Ceratobasidium theobromae TaxID=1582974 RepID=A0A5N5Q817_9AGAM|nr:hypothetical protein CTheo_8665 [Ceratobasidium theobromae]
MSHTMETWEKDSVFFPEALPQPEKCQAQAFWPQDSDLTGDSAIQASGSSQVKEEIDELAGDTDLFATSDTNNPDAPMDSGDGMMEEEEGGGEWEGNEEDNNNNEEEGSLTLVILISMVTQDNR